MLEYTPDNITELPENGVFVFGSNLNGNHAGGAAKAAHDLFGAEMGNPRGLQGRSYAFPTLGRNMDKLSPVALTVNRDYFYDCCISHPELTFYLTEIGMGIAGYDIEEIAPLFRVTLSNVIYPKKFIDFNHNRATQ